MTVSWLFSDVTKFSLITDGIRFAEPTICSSHIVWSWVWKSFIALSIIPPISPICPAKNGTIISIPLSNTATKIKYDRPILHHLLPVLDVNHTTILSTAIDSTYPVKIRYTKSSDENKRYHTYTTITPANQKINDMDRTWLLSMISWFWLTVCSISSSFSTFLGLMMSLFQRDLALEMTSWRPVVWVFIR